jgi:hypothetical protein
MFRVQATPLARDAEIKVGAHETLEATIEQAIATAIADNSSKLARVALARIAGWGSLAVGGGMRGRRRLHLHIDSKALQLRHNLPQNWVKSRAKAKAAGALGALGARVARWGRTITAGGAARAAGGTTSGIGRSRSRSSSRNCGGRWNWNWNWSWSSWSGSRTFVFIGFFAINILQQNCLGLRLQRSLKDFPQIARLAGHGAEVVRAGAGWALGNDNDPNNLGGSDGGLQVLGSLQCNVFSIFIAPEKCKPFRVDLKDFRDFLTKRFQSWGWETEPTNVRVEIGLERHGAGFLCPRVKS